MCPWGSPPLFENFLLVCLKITMFYSPSLKIHLWILSNTHTAGHIVGNHKSFAEWINKSTNKEKMAYFFINGHFVRLLLRNHLQLFILRNKITTVKLFLILPQMFLGIIFFFLMLFFRSNDNWSDKSFTHLFSTLKSLWQILKICCKQQTQPHVHWACKCSELWFLSGCSRFTVTLLASFPVTSRHFHVLGMGQSFGCPSQQIRCSTNTWQIGFY